MPPEKTNYNADGLLPWAEIARRMGLSVKQVQTAYYTAIMKLQDELGREGVTHEEFISYLRLRYRDTHIADSTGVPTEDG